MQEDIDTARNLIVHERNLSRSIHRRTCSKCRLALEPQLLSTFIMAEIKQAISYRRWTRENAPVREMCKRYDARYPRNYSPSRSADEVGNKVREQVRESLVLKLKVAKLREILSTKSPTALLRFKQKMKVFSEREKPPNNLNIP